MSLVAQKSTIHSWTHILSLTESHTAVYTVSGKSVWFGADQEIVSSQVNSSHFILSYRRPARIWKLAVANQIAETCDIKRLYIVLLLSQDHYHEITQNAKKFQVPLICVSRGLRDQIYSQIRITGIWNDFSGLHSKHIISVTSKYFVFIFSCAKLLSLGHIN